MSLWASKNREFGAWNQSLATGERMGFPVTFSQVEVTTPLYEETRFCLSSRVSTNRLVQPAEKGAFHLPQRHSVDHGTPIAFEIKPATPQQ
jgi:hypothetical protein